MQVELQQYASSWVFVWYFRAEQALVASVYLPSPHTPCSREEADRDFNAEGSAFSLISLPLWKISSGKNLLPTFEVSPKERKGKINH